MRFLNSLVQSLARAFGPIAASLMLLVSLPAAAETFGRTTVGTTPSGALRADFKRGSKFTLSEAGTATNLCAWLDSKGGVNGVYNYQSFRLVLYRDLNGAPGAKLAQTVEAGLSAEVDGRWLCYEIGWTPLTAGNYWLMIQTGGPNGPGPLRYFYDGPANFVANADNFPDSAADPAGPVDSGNGTVSIYATYIPAARLTHAGKMTVGATPSGGLRADFKRGSSFTISQPGKVTGLTAYLEGAAPGSQNAQNIRFALYEDVNGVPTNLVAETPGAWVYGGAVGRWYTFPVFDGVVHPGKYWFMIHSNTTAGLVRYRFDGTGNWFGNADAWDDGIANPFGAGSPGDGTMSAYVSFQPGADVPKAMGNTYIGADVTTPYGAAFHQASRFNLITPNATLNGLYAHIDGLGGASGSQQVRQAVWSDGDPNSDTPWPFHVLALSNVVTVNAGRQPGWVKLDIPPTALPPGRYWISLHLGPTAGVVRTYSDDNGEDVFTYEDAFADGPGGFINSDGELQGGFRSLSVYATYTTN